VPLTVGTAGHIDHGKTWLVRALTGKDTDRLPEEQARGISIDLGYAPLELPDGRRLSLVDVPGHERFVRNMVAGATGIDLFLLVIDAAEGARPQTHEHLAILRLLAIERGVVAVTKADAVDEETLELALAEARELAPEAEAIAVSAKTGAGLDELRAALSRAADGAGPSRDEGPTRLYVDRVFTLRGIGTVVTGTLWSGSIGQGDSVRVLPRGLNARVRSVQVHDQPVQRAVAGQRVALNLVGVGWRELGRGDLVTTPDADVAPTYLIDAALTLEPDARPLRRGARVHVHHGTREAPARVYSLEGEDIAPGATAFAQLRLEAPLVPLAGDHLIVRQLAPPDTVGGAAVIDAHPRKHGGSPQLLERLRARERGEEAPRVEEPEPSEPAPADDGPPPLDEAALLIGSLLRSDGREPRTDNELAEAAGLSAKEAGERLRRLAAAGQAVRVARNLHFHPEPLAELEARVIALCERDGSATIASVRDELSTSRKYAQALLEHLDGEKVTRRVGDEHTLRRSAG
jgi:selenocysteine-specific elongation factor